MSRPYVNSLPWRNRKMDGYADKTEAFTVPGAANDYTVELDERIVPNGTLVVVSDGDTLTPVPYGIDPGVDQVAVSYDLPLLKFHSSRESETGTVDYTPGGGVITSSVLADVASDPEWGDIGGTLADQTDLQSALSDKAAAVHTHDIADVNGLDSILDTIDNTLDVKQPLDNDLTAIAGLATTGLIARTGTGTAAARTITGAGDITVNNGNGVSGNPTVSAAANIARLATAQTWTAAQTYNSRVHYGGGLSTSSRSINSNVTLLLTDYHFTVSLATNSVTITLDTLNAAIGQEYYGEYFNQSSGLGNGYNVTFDAGSGNNIAGNGVYAQTYVGLNSGASRWFRIKKISSTAWSISSGAIQ